MPNRTIEMEAALALLDELSEMLRALDGRPLDPVFTNNKERMTAAANQSRSLLYAAHLADVLRVEVTSQYHRFKGQDPPVLAV